MSRRGLEGIILLLLHPLMMKEKLMVTVMILCYSIPNLLGRGGQLELWTKLNIIV
jgi:hypothetical protein